MNEVIVKVLAIFGGLSLILVLSFCLFALISDYIIKARYTYKYKHRFNKKPIAKCYCRDCKLWNLETGECSDYCNSRRMSETWFCCFAAPASAVEIARRDASGENE